MSKDQTVAKGTNVFILTSLRSDCHYSTITVDFTAPVNLTKPSQSIAPIFLRDRKSFTPGFVLPSDKTYYAGNSSYEKSRFEERVLKARQLHEELEKDRKQDQEFYSAIPSSTYCQICKQTFTCYQEHISGDDHIRELNSKIGNEYISEICDTLKGKLKKRKGEVKVKKIKKSAKRKLQTSVPLTVETRSKKRSKTEQKFGMASKVVNLSINTLCSMGNIY